MTRKLTDEEIVARLGEGATLKRVRSWRKRLGIETISPLDRHKVTPVEGKLRSLLVGSMLGDGRLHRTPNGARFMENHADDQREYIAWKVKQWGPWVKGGLNPVTWTNDGGTFQGWRFHTVCHPSLIEWHARFYDETGPKRLSREVIDYVDDFALAVWFMDDGSVGWWPRITFGMDDVSQAMALAIFERFGFAPRWQIHKERTGDFIFEGEDQAERFLALVKPHMPKTMERKLTHGFQGPHYQMRKALTPEALRELASKGVPIRRMAVMLGQTPSSVNRFLKHFGIEHPRKVGRPLRNAV